jgi:hypothetical protein
MIPHYLTFFHKSMGQLTPDQQADVIKRVLDFEVKYNSKDTPTGLVAAVCEAYLQPKPSMATLVMVEKDIGLITGHMVASCDYWYGTMYLNILQLVIDKPARLVPELSNEYLQIMINWGVQEWGATAIRAYALTPAHARAYKLYHNVPNEGRILCEGQIEEVCLGDIRSAD